MKYSDMNDYELLSYISENDEQARQNGSEKCFRRDQRDF